MITREDLCRAVEKFYTFDKCFHVDKFFDDVEEDCTRRFNVFCTINESTGNGNILILDTETHQYISWYKLTHLGRDLHSNITNVTDLESFIKAFKECKDKERG